MSDTEDFSADEKAYFESGGTAEAPKVEKTAGGLPEGQEQASETASEQEAAPEAGEVEGQEQGKPKQTVPLATLLEERKELKALREKERERDRQHAVWEERWRMLEQAQSVQQQPKGDEDPEPDPNVDIFAHQAWLSRQYAKSREVEQQRQQQSEAQQRERQLDRQVSDYWHSSAAEYAKATPDFQDAAAFLAQARDKDLEAMASIDSRLATQQGRTAVINHDLKQIVIAAAQQGRSPAEIVYAMAKQRGFTGKQAPAQQADVTQQVADLSAAVSGAKSLSQIGGGKVVTTSAQSIAEMTDKEFEAFMAKPENLQKWAAAAGR